MGAEQVMAAVADAGPLIHLNEIGCLVLVQIFDVLHIPRMLCGQKQSAKRGLLKVKYGRWGTSNNTIYPRLMWPSSFRPTSWKLTRW